MNEYKCKMRDELRIFMLNNLFYGNAEEELNIAMLQVNIFPVTKDALFIKVMVEFMWDRHATIAQRTIRKEMPDTKWTKRCVISQPTGHSSF